MFLNFKSLTVNAREGLFGIRFLTLLLVRNALIDAWIISFSLLTLHPALEPGVGGIQMRRDRLMGVVHGIWGAAGGSAFK